MTMLTRLEQWRERGAITPEQMGQLSGFVRDEPFSLFFEINVLLYLGVVAFVAGLGWTVATWSRQIGDVLVVGVLFAILLGCFLYCASRAAAWSFAEVAAPSVMFDYVLYLGSLVWGVELTYLEKRFHLLSGQWDLYLLATAGLFFVLAYRFDNRFVLSLALSSLAGWFGVTVSHGPAYQDERYRMFALAYSAVVGAGGIALKRVGVKPHFFGVYLNLVANVLFWTVLSGVFDREGSGLWLVALLAVCGGSLAWGLRRRQFAFVAYAAVYGYAGISSLILRDSRDPVWMMLYLVFTAGLMIAALVHTAHTFGRQA